MTTGIHHVTAICGDPQANVDFYAKKLGLRLVKVNVNMDDPGTYHFYYGDPVGSPGSAMTFFPWPGAPRGRVGRGQATATAFSVPPGSLDFWADRLGVDDRLTRFGAPVLQFRDPDDMPLELVEGEDGRAPWTGNGIEAEHAIRGFHSVTLATHDPSATQRVLTADLGFRQDGQEDGRTRFTVGSGLPHQMVDIVQSDDDLPGRMGVGVCHHVAFRVPDDATQSAVADAVRRSGTNVTSVQERFYFRSVYFREPGNVLFEVATDQPGFTADEPFEHLGERLCLPPWFEDRRPQIASVLPRFTSPAGVAFP